MDLKMNISSDWRDNACSVKEKLNYTLKNENTQQDVVIVVGSGPTETKIKAHSFMLFIGSQVLENLVAQAKRNNEGMKEIKLLEVPPETMKFVLKYIYTDGCNVVYEDSLDILKASLKLNMRGLTALCIANLKDELTAANVLRIFEESVKLNVEELVQHSQQFILKNAREVFLQEQFLSITNENLCKLLAFDELEIEELSIFNSIMSWAQFECKRTELEDTSKNLRLVLKKIVPLIRFTLMPMHEFASVVVPTKILDSQEVNDVLVHLAIQSSNVGKPTEHPLWILSSSERKLTYKKKIVASTSSEICETKAETEGNLQVEIQPKTTVKDKLLQYLKNISGKTTIAGLFIQRKRMYYNIYNTDIRTFHSITGVNPGILTLTMPSYIYEKDVMHDWHWFTEEIISMWKSGYLVHIIWWTSENPLAQLQMFEELDEIQWNDDLAKGDDHLNKESREWKKNLNSIVPYFQQLQDAGVVVICDFLPWIKYKKYSWGGRLEMHGTKKLYQITHDYMTNTHKLHSLLWTWSFDISGDTTKLADFWPGNNYVDVVSVCIGKYEEQMEMKLYQNLLEIVGDKPISMENLHNLSPSAVVVLQPRWTWFTTPLRFLEYEFNDSYKYQYQHPLIINKEDNEFFKTLHSN